MKRTILFIVPLILGLLSANGQTAPDYVDLFIGTSGDHGQLDPSATVPFGMIKPGPDTNPGNHGGYDYRADTIVGFSQNRISGVGCSGAGGNLRILPVIAVDEENGIGYLKESEKASPGYYAVKLANRINVELTATTQTAIHKYTFPKSGDAGVIFDTGSSFSKLVKSSYDILNKNELYVSITARNVCDDGKYTTYFHVWCNKDLNLVRKEGTKLFFDLDVDANEEVLFYVTVSAISCDDARNQWESETRNLTFDEVSKAAGSQWEDLLSRIVVEGKEEYKTLFYTHLYHLFLNPVKTENLLKQFRAEDGKIHESAVYTHYDTWSVWDNFRNKFSLYTLIAPDVSTDIAKSLTDLYKYGKPWKYGKNSAVPTVRAEHTGILLLDFYRRGITDFDLEPLYEKLNIALRKADKHTPDKKLESCYDYWALAQFAALMGKTDDAGKFSKMADSYKPVWQEKFLHITDKSDIMHGDGLYEGTLWQYRWSVLFDLEGMIAMIGGKEKFTEQLEYFFENNLYNHGNQPDLHTSYLFNYSARPWLTQKWVNRILTKEMVQNYGTHAKWDAPYVGRIYRAGAEGYIPEMDDDDGTMAAWYVLSAMGIYPVEIGKPEFQLTSPIFDRVIIKLSGDKTFEISTNNLRDDSFYIESATLNGEKLNRTVITQREIINGGKLVFNLSETPNDY